MTYGDVTTLRRYKFTIAYDVTITEVVTVYGDGRDEDEALESAIVTCEELDGVDDYRVRKTVDCGDVELDPPDHEPDPNQLSLMEEP